MLGVGVKLVALVAVLGLARNRVVVGLVGRNDSAVLAKRRVLEQTEVVAGVVDGGCHQNGRAPVIVQTRLDSEVVDDVGDDALLALTGTHQLFHRRPALTQNRTLKVVQPLGFLIKPRIDSFL